MLTLSHLLNILYPGSPPDDQPPIVNLAVQFVTEILLKLPIRICVAIANQVIIGVEK